MGDPFKGLEKILPVHVTTENILPAVPTAHDVINRPRIFHSQLARHAGKTAGSIPIASRLWFDPFSSQNAVRTQIWSAVAVCLLVAILKKRLHLDSSLYTILQILSLTLFEKTPIRQALSQPPPASELPITQNYPCLPGF
jgi:hypothetical protein